MKFTIETKREGARAAGVGGMACINMQDATHQHEDIIYDAAILRMAACLEWLIQERHGESARFNLRDVERFCDCARAPGHVRDKMREVVKIRGQIAHKRNLDHQVNFNLFSQTRGYCLRVDEWAEDKLGLTTGIRDVMVSHSLPYLMGNASDVIKRGALAELTDWFFASRPDAILRYADPFGGRPWGRPLNAEIPARIEAVSSDCELRSAQPHPDARIYGSAHVVRNVASAAGREARVFASDSDKLARSDLEASGLQLLQERRGYSSKDGHSILNLVDEFDLILVDPFSNFLRDEFWKNDGKHFREMLKAVRTPESCGLWLAVFVLNMNPRNRVGEKYADFKREIANLFIGLHCPKIPDSEVHGEDRFETEILLISSQVKEGKISGLRKRLIRFAESAQSALNADIQVIGATSADN